MKQLEVTLGRDEEDRWDYRSVLTVKHKGEVILEKYDGGEPEDNSFGRDWNFVPGIIKKAYELGYEDGRNSDD